jgi:glycosyltransferase involved in cell wall biosynthesis
LSKKVFDVAYLTTDSVSEGVGSSQILPLLFRISKLGLKVNLVSFEKVSPSNSLKEALSKSGIVWNMREFKSNGISGGFSRLFEIRNQIPSAHVLHARSDVPAAAAGFFKHAPVLWDIRSLWSEQKSYIESNLLKKKLLVGNRLFENFAAGNSDAINTLTHAVVPILEKRHRNLPEIRSVVPTTVDLNVFKIQVSSSQQKVAFFSGTYNSYYDLDLTAKFISDYRKSGQLEVVWAKPRESDRNGLGLLEKVIHLKSQEEMSVAIGRSSFGVAVCKMDAGESLKASMPTKIAEFLACGKPVLINKGLGDFDAYIREFNAGVILESDLDIRSGVEQMRQLLNDPDTALRCRALASRYLSLDSGVKEYLRIYESLGKFSI